MLYFAYGSNMSRARLAARIRIIESLGVYLLKNHQLLFHKIGDDGSAKCDAFFDANRDNFVLGVLYRIEPDDRGILDAIEGVGKGYDVKDVNLIHQDTGLQKQAFMYYATRIDQDVVPHSWYKHHVVHGAISANLPQDYIQKITDVRATKDWDLERHLKEMSIYLDLE